MLFSTTFDIILIETIKEQKMTNSTRKNGFLQAGNMASFLDVSKGTLARWRKEGKIQESSWIEPSDGHFLYEIEAVLKNLRTCELILNDVRRAEESRCDGCSCSW